MKLFEFEAKNEFLKHNIPVPNGILAATPEQAKQAAAKLKMPCIIKAQVLAGGRAKAGGILTANSIQQVESAASTLLALSDIIQKLYQTCLDNDAELAEINPLAETAEGEFVALDARMIIDDNALFRHPEYAKRETQQLTVQEASALKNNLAYVKLSGDIGIAGNGAGLVMATLDLLNYFGGKPANFLDLGGGATIEQITAAAKIVLSDPDTKVVLINILGGITHCDDVAKGILQAVNETGSKKPLIVRLLGTNQQEGQKILTDAGMQVYDSMEEAAKQAVALTKKGDS